MWAGEAQCKHSEQGVFRKGEEEDIYSVRPDPDLV